MPRIRRREAAAPASRASSWTPARSSRPVIATELGGLTRWEHGHAANLEPAEQRPITVDEAEHRPDRHGGIGAAGEDGAHGVGLSENPVDELRLVAAMNAQVLGAVMQESPDAARR